jgi:hypothetical protein
MESLAADANDEGDAARARNAALNIAAVRSAVTRALSSVHDAEASLRQAELGDG